MIFFVYLVPFSEFQHIPADGRLENCEAAVGLVEDFF
jgi:hypothetical protein